MKKPFVIAYLVGQLFFGAALANSRVKDITFVQGIRDNQLVGYGLVIGLAGTGDGLRNSPFTEKSMRSMLQKMGVAVEPQSIGSKNVAAVVVTATLPPFVTEGTRIDVTVSSMGDATSLNGGTLVMTPLLAANGETFAVAQGSVSIGGFSVGGDATSVKKGVATGGIVLNGAIVEQDNTAEINSLPRFALQLHNPDFATAVRVSRAINTFSKKTYGERVARAKDLRTVEITRPAKVSITQLFADIGGLIVDVDVPARVVVDEKSGTVVIGQDVRVSPVAVSHGNLIIKVSERPIASQPKPFSDGKTVVLPETDIEIEDTGKPVGVLEGTSLDDLVDGLNNMGVKPGDIIDILQSLKDVGALQAELIVQ
jgi:flagellar P-ring protein FlgI